MSKKYRSSGTGRYVSSEQVEADPLQTVAEDGTRASQLRRLRTFADQIDADKSADSPYDLAFADGVKRAVAFFDE